MTTTNKAANDIRNIARAIEGNTSRRLVRLTAMFAEMFEMDTVSIFEVVDTRKTFGGYELRIAPVTAEGLDFSEAFEVDSADVVPL